MHVAVESEGALLHVEGECVDVEVAGALQLHRHAVSHIARAVHTHVEGVRGFVLVHAA